MSEESQTVIGGGPTLPHLQPLLLVYGHKGCPLLQHNALKRSTPPVGRCFICAVPTHVCAWGGLRVVAFSFGRCAYADVRLLNASCPTIALIRRPLLLPRLPSHAHTPPCASLLRRHELKPKRPSVASVLFCLFSFSALSLVSCFASQISFPPAFPDPHCLLTPSPR